MGDAQSAVTVDDIRNAAGRFRDDETVQRTPIEVSRSLSDRVDADVFLKMEHLQRTGSFKIRGAYNRMRSLAACPETTDVVAASAGNHAQGVALAATNADLPATIIMPTDAPQAKIDATRAYGAEVELHGSDFPAAMNRAKALAEADGTTLVHAFDDPEIVAGQGTIGLEIIEALPAVDTVIVPIGGGGLIGGIATALSTAPDVRVIGVQAASAATVPHSLQKGEPVGIDDINTVADGIATGGISELTYELIREHVDEVLTVSDEAIAEAIIFLLERAKQLVEGAGAAPVAALFDDRVDIRGETVVPVLSGGNLDMSMLQTLLTHELTARSQLIRLRVRIQDVPGEMNTLSGIIGEKNANIRTAHHYRADESLKVGEAYLVFLVETSGDSHATAIQRAIRAEGYEVERVN
ncbi:threonine ammonia-lyase (plasmid) [Haloferacaceae archaeon DSL9]